MAYSKVAHLLRVLMAVTPILLAANAACSQETSYYSGKLLHSFGGPGDGYSPRAGLIFDRQGNLYGTTLEGGTGCILPGCGTVFQLTLNSDGTWNENVLHRFLGGDGANPYGSISFDAAGNLYGTTGGGGQYHYGTVFQLAPGSGGTWNESVLYSFRGTTDGSLPYAGVLVAGPAQLYGTAFLGGTYNAGVVFALNRVSISGWYELVLYPFTGGNDGGGPSGPLTRDTACNLYGTTFSGGAHGAGVVYKLTPNPFSAGWTETVLYAFQGVPYGSSADGANPNSGVIFDAAGNLYGTTQFGGNGPGGGCGCGTVFKLAPNSHGTWDETVLYAFGEGDGADPVGPLVFDRAGDLYVTTNGTPFNYGEVIKLMPSGGMWTPTYLFQFGFASSGDNLRVV